MSYAELHCHSAFSFLDGASLPDELVAAAAELGHTALALTDHDTVSGSMEFAQAARQLGLRAIHGAEVTVLDHAGMALEDARHLTLLVRDAQGWRISAGCSPARARPRARPTRGARSAPRRCRSATSRSTPRGSSA